MSSTRHAAAGSPLRQERYTSSPAITDTGLKPACVAKRCAVLDDAARREAIWFLQARSHQPGGLASVAAALMEQFPARLCPPGLVGFKGNPEAMLTPERVRELRDECGAGNAFLMRGEYSDRERGYLDLMSREVRGEFGYEPRQPDDEVKRIERKSAGRPASFNAATFIEHARDAAAGELVDHLLKLCLDPEQPFASPWYFHDLPGALAEMMRTWAEENRRGMADTEVARRIREAIEYAAETGSVVLLSAPNAVGKSFHARAECQQRPGAARYVQAPTGNDRRTFFRAIADALGGPAGSSWKALEMQERVEEILPASGLVLVFDDALQLLPDREREATPDRIDWIVTALAERGLPAVLITSPSFDVRLEAIQQRSRWSMDGFNHRVCRLPMPAALTRADVAATAAAMFPAASKSDLEAVTTFTMTAGGGGLRFMDRIRCSAEFIARRAGLESITSDGIRQALTQYALPASRELAKAQQHAKAKGTPRFRKSASPIAAPDPRAVREPVAPAPQSAREGLAEAPRREMAPADFSTAAAE